LTDTYSQIDDVSGVQSFTPSGGRNREILPRR
jgi:hypothetical protein